MLTARRAVVLERAIVRIVPERLESLFPSSQDKT